LAAAAADVSAVLIGGVIVEQAKAEARVEVVGKVGLTRVRLS